MSCDYLPRAESRYVNKVVIITSMILGGMFKC